MSSLNPLVLLLLASLVLVVGQQQAEQAQPQEQTQAPGLQAQPQTPQPQPQNPETQTQVPGATTNETSATKHPLQLATTIPPLDSNLELLDYPLDLLAGLHFSGFAPDDSDGKTSKLIGKHHNEDELYDYLKELATAYPQITRLYSIGESVEKRKLWALEISEHPGEHERLKPEFRYVANIHGNEAVGRELLLHLAKLILDNYHAPEPPAAAGHPEEALKPTGQKFIKKLVASTRIHLLPSMNPDGYVRSQVACKFEEPSRRGRVNANNVDLNRNFPDRVLGTEVTAGTQPEVLSIIKWSREEPFVLSATLHGGSLVAIYPPDGSTNKTLTRDPARQAPDHELLRDLALSYAHAHPVMSQGTTCYDKCADYHPETFEEGQGTSTGAGWYSLYGGLQDWMYSNTNSLELTLELGCNQYPPAEALLQYWSMNKVPLLHFMRQVHRGIKGTVQDEQTGAYLSGVSVHVDGIERDTSSTKAGDYFRLLPTGEHDVHFSHPHYEPVKLHVALRNGMAQIHNIKMKLRDPSAPTPPAPASQNSIWSGGQSEGAEGEPTREEAGQSGRPDEEHSLVVATLVMSVITVLLLLGMLGAYFIQKRRYQRSQSVSVEMQPRGSSTGQNLTRQISSVQRHLTSSSSTIQTNLPA